MTPDEERFLKDRVAALTAMVIALTPIVRELWKDKNFPNAEEALARFEAFWLGQSVTDNEIRLAKLMLRAFLKK